MVRRFQLWEYDVSHGSALIRSPKSGTLTTNIDVMLFGVEYLAVPRHLASVVVEHADPRECRRAAKLLRRRLSGQTHPVTRDAAGPELDPAHVWALCSQEVRHLVVAAAVEVRETSMDIFESPFRQGPESQRDPRPSVQQLLVGARVAALLEAIASGAPSFPRAAFGGDLFDVGEIGLGLETLCENLVELGIVLEVGVRAELVSICRSAGVDRQYWEAVVR